MGMLYYWLGFVVFWAAVAGLLWWAWQQRPRNHFTRRLGNAWHWIRTFLLRQPLRIPKEWPAWAFAWYQPRRRCTIGTWERDIIAAAIRNARRHGFTT